MYIFFFLCFLKKKNQVLVRWYLNYNSFKLKNVFNLFFSNKKKAQMVSLENSRNAKGVGILVINL